MCFSLRSPAACFGAVATSLVAFFTPVLGAAPATPVASAAPFEVIKPADLKNLQDAIKGLHDRFEDQGKILSTSGSDLGTLTKRVEDYLKPSTLDPLKSSIVTLVAKLGEAQAALGKLAEVQERQSTATTAQYRDVSAALARLQEQLAQADKADKAAEAGLAQLRQTIAASRAPGLASALPADEAATSIPLLGIVIAATLLLAAIVVMNARAQRLALGAARDQMTAALTQTRETLLAEIRAPVPLVVDPAVASVGPVAGAEELAEIRAAMQKLLEHLNPAVPSVNTDDHTTRKFPAVPSDEQVTARHPAPEGLPTASWPAAFSEADSPLSSWRERIESHLSSEEHPGLPVLSAMQALRALCARQPAPLFSEVADAVFTLSQTLYAYWDTFPELSEDDRTRASSDWMQAIKALVSTVAPMLEIREIVVGARFDSDSMQTVKEGSGNHLGVAAVFSWATLDRSGERVKIVHRARIATN